MELIQVFKVTVFKFTMYNIQTDEAQLSRRMGTPDAIKAMGGTPIGRGFEIDKERLSKDFPGLTDIDFQP